VTTSHTSNIAFAGLTAAGKTTHAKRLADELGYQYVSATEILLEILGIEQTGESVWLTRLGETNAARSNGSVDAELEERLVSLNRTRQRTVFDTWALAWIGDSPLLRIWIESDLESRVRKCLVSQGDRRTSPDRCRSLLDEKDSFNRQLFQRRHGFDLFTDRHRYDAVLDNSHLIPNPTESAARSGIEAFAPVIHAVATCVMADDQAEAERLIQTHPQEVRRITLPSRPQPR
jgi:cytidylate kinase